MDIRIAHFSDLHYAPETLVEVDRCFAYAVDAAIGRGIDAAVISGDATDHAQNLHSPAVDALGRNVRRLADHCPVLILQGTFSHEPPGTLNVFRHFGGRYPVHVADRLQQVALDGEGSWRVSDGWRFDALPDGTRALFSALPTVNKAVVAAAAGAASAAEEVGTQLSTLLRGYGCINDGARGLGIPTVGVAHGTVHGSTNEHGVPMAGNDHEFTTGALFAARASAFMLGHIHLHQSWESNGRLVAYAGSPARLHYGEEGDKGFLIWTVGAAGSRFERIATPARRTIDLCFDGPPDPACIRARIDELDVEGAFIRVRWQVSEAERDQVDRGALLAALTGAAQVKLEGRVLPVQIARMAGISRMGLRDRITVWAEAAGEEAAPLLSCVEWLAARDTESIARTILSSGAAPVRREVNRAAMITVEEGAS
ncbi:metallophosphoesterase family protein [Duganella vulcania]|uniref:metallophosphoesterase family protein n=1 Tax=Duganella vulcania TaxID=2692166 RepID=UPI0015837631|nr:metallophosphatase family protein [Duganella vulcania]